MISSKSILSPGRTVVRDPLTSISTSRSRRIRNNGSVRRGGSTRMFPTTAKKRGSFENPEPSSPKVTCIGQIRVRSKKIRAKKLRNASRKHSSGAGEVSFKNLEHPLNGFPSKRRKDNESLNFESNGNRIERKRVQFPVTVCDAFRAFGSDFSCLFPCRAERRKEEKTVAVPDGGGGGEKEIELVVGNNDEESVRKSRRHVFEDLQIVDDRIEGYTGEVGVSICVPPKNVLMLMRYRSDSMKIEAFKNGVLESDVAKTDAEDKIVEVEAQLDDKSKKVMNLDPIQENVEDLNYSQRNLEVDHDQKNEAYQDQEHDNVQQGEDNQDQEHDNVQQDEANQDQEHDIDNVQQDEDNQDQEHDNVQQDEANQDQEHDNLKQDNVGHDQDQEHNQTEEESFNLVSLFQEIENQDNEIHEEESFNLVSLFQEIENQDYEIHEDDDVAGVLERESGNVLPECLLMMMYEPKLSMEVSKETWVCRKDFIRRQSSWRKPPAPVKPGCEDELIFSANTTVNDVMSVGDGGFPVVLQQPARSSCSLPAAASMAVVIEQKLANAVGYEPFVLTRCKSEPVKTAASKLQPESCVLENRKLERLSRVTIGVGAAGLGF